jgi:hypothetical protein
MINNINTVAAQGEAGYFFRRYCSYSTEMNKALPKHCTVYRCCNRILLPPSHTLRHPPLLGPPAPNTNHKQAAPATKSSAPLRWIRTTACRASCRMCRRSARSTSRSCLPASRCAPCLLIAAATFRACAIALRSRPPGIDPRPVGSRGSRSRAAFRPDRSLASHLLPICFLEVRSSCTSPVNDWHAVAFVGETGSESCLRRVRIADYVSYLRRIYRSTCHLSDSHSRVLNALVLGKLLDLLLSSFLLLPLVFASGVPLCQPWTFVLSRVWNFQHL